MDAVDAGEAVDRSLILCSDPALGMPKNKTNANATPMRKPTRMYVATRVEDPERMPYLKAEVDEETESRKLLKLAG